MVVEVMESVEHVFIQCEGAMNNDLNIKVCHVTISYRIEVPSLKSIIIEYF